MFGEAKMLRNGFGCLEFAPVSLAVVEGQTDDAVALLQGQCRCCGGIQPTGEQCDRSALTPLRRLSS